MENHFVCQKTPKLRETETRKAQTSGHVDTMVQRHRNRCTERHTVETWRSMKQKAERPTETFNDKQRHTHKHESNISTQKGRRHRNTNTDLQCLTLRWFWGMTQLPRSHIQAITFQGSLLEQITTSMPQASDSTPVLGNSEPSRIHGQRVWGCRSFATWTLIFTGKLKHNHLFQADRFLF